MRPKMGVQAGERGRRGSADVRSMIHDSCYHKLNCLSNGIIVLVLAKFDTFVRKILQEEENKGVELTVCLCKGSRVTEDGGRMRPARLG